MLDNAHAVRAVAGNFLGNARFWAGSLWVSHRPISPYRYRESPVAPRAVAMSGRYARPGKRLRFAAEAAPARVRAARKRASAVTTARHRAYSERLCVVPMLPSPIGRQIPVDSLLDPFACVRAVHVAGIAQPNCCCHVVDIGQHLGPQRDTSHHPASARNRHHDAIQSPIGADCLARIVGRYGTVAAIQANEQLLPSFRLFASSHRPILVRIQPAPIGERRAVASFYADHRQILHRIHGIVGATTQVKQPQHDPSGKILRTMTRRWPIDRHAAPAPNRTAPDGDASRSAHTRGENRGGARLSGSDRT